MLDDLVFGAAVALACSALLCRALIGAGPVDLPTEARKAHRAPTPTSGGIGVALGFAAGLIALALFSSAWRHEVSAQGAALLSIGASFAYGFLALGFIDDARPLGAGLKFVLFSALAFGVALSVGVVDSLPFGGGAEWRTGFWIGLFGTALWVFTVVNCVNFMDGANGLAMGSVAIGLIALGGISAAQGALSAAAIALCGAGAILGFLIWNFPRGRLFAGDSGALFAGAVVTIAALIAVRRADLSPWIPPILFFPLLADALLTLGWRAWRGRSLLEGHSEHLYQIALRAGWSHARVALTYWAAMAACGAIGFAVAAERDSAAPWITLAALAVAALVVSGWVRSAAKKRGIEEI